MLTSKIGKLAPVETPTKPLDKVEKKYYRRKTFINLSIECLIVEILFILNLNIFGFVMCLGIVISAGVLILGKCFSSIRVCINRY